MDDEAFFNILDIPFELMDTKLLGILIKNAKKLTLKLTIFFTFLLKLTLYLIKSVNQQEVLTSGG